MTKDGQILPRFILGKTFVFREGGRYVIAYDGCRFIDSIYSEEFYKGLFSHELSHIIQQISLKNTRKEMAKKYLRKKIKLFDRIVSNLEEYSADDDVIKIFIELL